MRVTHITHTHTHARTHAHTHTHTTSRPRPRPVPFGVSRVSRAKVAVDVAKVDVVAAGQPTVSFIDVKNVQIKIKNV